MAPAYIPKQAKIPPEGSISLQVFPQEVYDLIEVVILNLAAGGKSAEGETQSSEVILNFLSVLFTNTITSEEKKNILQNEYHIKMTEEFKGDVNNMCNLSQLVWNEGRESGFSEGQDIATMNFVKQMILSSEPAEKISRYTGLSLERLETLAHDIGMALPAS